jgi:hypothetical protein
MKLTESFWTSGSNLNCRDGYKWCTANVDLYLGVPWGANQPDMLQSKEWCAQINIMPGADNQSVLADIDCTIAKKYICEVSFIYL